MALREIGKARRQREEFVSISGKYKRLTLFFKVYDLMKSRFGDDFNYIRVFVDDKERGLFWMRPDATGGLSIRIVGKGNKIISIYGLLDEMGWTRQDTVRLPVSWDSKNKAFLVDCRDSLKEQARLGKQRQEVLAAE